MTTDQKRLIALHYKVEAQFANQHALEAQLTRMQHQLDHLTAAVKILLRECDIDLEETDDD